MLIQLSIFTRYLSDHKCNTATVIEHHDCYCAIFTSSIPLLLAVHFRTILSVLFAAPFDAERQPHAVEP